MKAPRELTEAFKEGVDERYEAEILEAQAGDDPWPGCFLAQFDRGNRPCEGRFERFHFIGRQRVRQALQLVWWQGFDAPFDVDTALELVNLAEWDSRNGDSRNGGVACEAHHRRFDKHLVSIPSEQVVAPYSALPEHVLDFASDWGLEDELTDRFPELEAA